MINKDTQVCISMAAKAGNFGCSIHNAAFQRLSLNYIYKSFSVSEASLSSAVDGIRALGIRGAGITMPHKIKVIEHVDFISPEVSAIGASNTLVNTEGVISCYNTDAYSSYEVLSRYKNNDEVYILGNGGYAKAVKYSANKIFENINTITREEWSDIGTIQNSVIFNCTPVRDIKTHESSVFIDCSVETTSGQELALLQASRQFELYTGVKFPIEYVKSSFAQILMSTIE
tara:strand:- start:16043 stop:16732 length:690 start_codon:yes stop_codon:yes gene_type:complete